LFADRSPVSLLDTELGVLEEPTVYPRRSILHKRCHRQFFGVYDGIIKRWRKRGERKREKERRKGGGEREEKRRGRSGIALKDATEAKKK
jgi:hypothetical protein